MRSSLVSLVTGAAILAAPVAFCHAQATGSTGSAPRPGAPSITPAPAKTVSDTLLPIDGVAAVVGDQIILISEVISAALQQRAQGAQVRTEAEFIALQRSALDQLIQSRLLVNKAKDEKIEYNEADGQDEIQKLEQRVRKDFKSDAELRTALREAGYGSVEEWRKLQLEQFKDNRMQQELYQKMRRDGKMTAVNVSAAQVDSAFEQNKDKLPKLPARVGVRQIVIATEPSEASKKRARDKADSLRKELTAHPDEFESAAKRFSMDGTAEVGGDLGWNRRGNMVPEFDRVMFALNPGVISPVVETSFGYHIIRVDRVQPAEVKARHILIKPVVDSADDLRAHARAAEVAETWRKGASYDSLVIRYHDERGAEDKSIPEYIRDSLPESYRNAIEGKKVGDILDPFPVPDRTPGVFKYIVAQLTLVEEAGEMSPAAAKERLRSQLSEEGGIKRLIDQLKSQTYVSVRYDPAKASVLK